MTVELKKYLLVFGVLFLSGYFLVYPIFKYTKKTFQEVTLRMNGTYVQNLQVAKFISLLPKDTCVAITDLGAVTYLNEGLKIVDLLGLGTPEIADIVTSKDLTKDDMNRISKKNKVEYVITFKGTFADIIPDDWIEIGLWHVLDFSVSGARNIIFFATDEGNIQDFRYLFKKFSDTETVGLTTQFY